MKETFGSKPPNVGAKETIVEWDDSDDGAEGGSGVVTPNNDSAQPNVLGSIPNEVSSSFENDQHPSSDTQAPLSPEVFLYNGGWTTKFAPKASSAPATYRAPEILIKDKQCIEASDIYSWGITLCSMLLQNMFPLTEEELHFHLQLVQKLINNHNTSSSTALCPQRDPRLIRTARLLFSISSQFMAGKKPEQLLGDPFEVKNGLLGVKRDIFFRLIGVGGMYPEAVRKLVGISGESVEWVIKHPYYVFAAQAGQERYSERVSSEYTDKQILTSIELLNGNLAYDVFAEGCPFFITAQEELELEEIRQLWRQAKTIKDLNKRKEFITSQKILPRLAELFLDRTKWSLGNPRTPLVRNPDLQQWLWETFPLWKMNLYATDVAKIIVPINNPSPNNNLTVVLHGTQYGHEYTYKIKELFAWAPPKTISIKCPLADCFSSIKRLEEEGLVSNQTTTLVVPESVDNTPQSVSVGALKACFPNLKVIVVTFRRPNNGRPSDVGIYFTLKQFEDCRRNNIEIVIQIFIGNRKKIESRYGAIQNEKDKNEKDWSPYCVKTMIIRKPRKTKYANDNTRPAF
jgi:hypothetical protein